MATNGDWLKDCTMDILSTFLTKKYALETFQQCVESFGVILKGKSVENLPKISNEFNDCFIVNNFDLEMKVVGDCLLNKNVVHFVCRTKTTPMTAENYRRLNVKEVQLSNSSVFEHFRALIQVIPHYQSLGLKTVFLPKDILRTSKGLFGSEYAKKFPNTGHLAIYYAASVIKPKTLWVIGLDFYQSDYLCRDGRPHLSPIERQRSKMKRIKAVEVIQDWIEGHPETKFNIVTYYDRLKPQKNLEVINYSQAKMF